MPTLDELVSSVRHSPHLPQVVSVLQRQLEDERQRRRRFYEEMTPDQKVEFIDGEVVLHSPARAYHLEVTDRLKWLMESHVMVRGLGRVHTEKCLCVFPRNDYEPDIVFFGPEKNRTINRRTLKFPVPDFAVEILSESTEARDRGVKREDYEANGVGEYWIVDADARTVDRHRLRDRVYVVEKLVETDRIYSHIIEGFSVPLRLIFDADAYADHLRTLLGDAPPPA